MKTAQHWFDTGIKMQLEIQQLSPLERENVSLRYGLKFVESIQADARRSAMMEAAGIAKDWMCFGVRDAILATIEPEKEKE